MFTETAALALLSLTIGTQDATSAPGTQNAATQDAAGPVMLRSFGLNERGELRVRFDDAARSRLQNAAGRVRVQMPLSLGEAAMLDLERFEVLAPDSKFFTQDKAGRHETALPHVLLLRGEVVGEPGSHAFLALADDGGGSGSISHASGSQYRIATDALNGQTRGLLVQTAGDDLPAFNQFCVMLGVPNEPLADGASSTFPDAQGFRALNLAVEADQSLVQLFPSNAAAQSYIVQLAAAVSDIYMRDLNFRIILRSARTWPNGGEPFSADDLSGFQSYWISHEDHTGLNLVHMLSGRRDLAYGGIAFLANACSDFAFGISGFILGNFPQPVPISHLGNWDVDVMAHEMGHNLGTPHTHDYSPPIDQCTSGVLERGTIMSYCHTNQGGLLNTDLYMHARVAEYIAENNALAICLWHDCNGNGVDDAIDIAFGTSADVNQNGIPDSCEDCNQNGVLDSIEIANGAPDVNHNGVLDSCEPDCNANGIPDTWEISLQLAADLNGNNVPDSCEPDCDGNGVADFLDIHNGTYADLDRNRVPDVCQDCNSNGVPDWIDVDRELNIYISQAGGSTREYHAASGVFIRALNAAGASQVYDMAFGPDRQLYLASFNDHRIVRIDLDANSASDFVAAGAGGLLNPSSLTFGPDGNLYVASQGTKNILKYNGTNGAFMSVFVPTGTPSLATPWGMRFGPNGNLFVISDGNRVAQYDGSTGAFVSVVVSPFGGTLNNARGLAFLPNGDLLVTNRGADRITRYDSAGNFLGKFNDIFPLPMPWSIAVGPNGDVYAAQTTSDIRVIEYDAATGRYLRSFVRGDSGLSAPTAIAFRPQSPNDLNLDGVPDVCEKRFCSADISPLAGDGAVNVGDLIAVINAWGACPQPCSTFCPADVTHDCSVNVNDLLAIISAWGPCP